LATRALRAEPVSEVTANRLSLYLRCLSALESDGIRRISSQEFARRFQLNSDQIRKDLAHFGEFGIRGVGYEVGALRRHLVSILGLDRTHNVAIVGAGHLGQALADYGGFNSGGFRIVALFDRDPRRIGSRSRSGIPVLDVRTFAAALKERGIDVGAITVPPDAAQQVCDLMVQAGVRAVLNFAPVRLRAPRQVRIKNVDLKIHLETLAFYLTNG
jgi:redox-sensing transcriptional repressor